MNNQQERRPTIPEMVDRAFIGCNTGINDLRNICIELANQVDILTMKLKEKSASSNGAADFRRKGEFVEHEAIKTK